MPVNDLIAPVEKLLAGFLRWFNESFAAWAVLGQLAAIAAIFLLAQFFSSHSGA